MEPSVNKTNKSIRFLSYIFVASSRYGIAGNAKGLTGIYSISICIFKY